MAKQKFVPVCKTCRSTEVIADAYVFWNYSAQRWELETVSNKAAYCAACDGETVIAWEEKK